jgi:hypothetical protein
MWISELVTPRAVAPLALPDPQMAFSEPKSPGPALALGAALLAPPADDGPVLACGVLELERPHAETSASAMRNAEAEPTMARAGRLPNE